MFKLFFLFFFISSTLFQLYAIEREAVLKRIHAHLVVQDFAAACQEAQQGLAYFPNDKLFYEASIKALAHVGDEKGMCEAWNRYANFFPNEAWSNHELHEQMAWAVVCKGAESPVPLIRLYALLGSFFSNDAKGIPLIKRYLHDKNAQIRSAAVQLTSHLRDALLCDEILSLLSEEKNRKVRLGIMKAIGKMKIQEGNALLFSIIADHQTTAEEKAAATAGVLSLFEKIDRQEILTLTSSNRAGLRLLACEAVSHLRSQRDADQMILLASDNNSEVRAAALHSLGLLAFSMDKQPLIQLARAKTQDRSPEVAITAAWLLTIVDPMSSREAFMPLVQHSKRDVRLHAAAAIAATGRYGVALAKDLFKTSQDPFFKMNLAVGLIYQQVHTLEACRSLDTGLINEPGRWMWKEEGPFRVLAPSNVRQEDEIPNAPEAINQLTRLEILNMLAVMRYPGSEAAIRGFLQQHKWGIAGLASALLLMEGDETSLNLIQGLLNDPDARIRMQAALTLSLWGGKEEAIAQLESGYPAADRETKERILEGLGKIGSRRSIPFLIQKLQESQQSLRLIAASSLLQCLYH